VLAGAGLDEALAPGDLARARWGLVTLAMAPAILAAATGGVAAAVAASGVVALAWLLPGRLVAARAAERRRRIGDQLPDLLELLGVCVEAGMALDPALRTVSERLAGPLGEELRRLLEDMQTGTPRGAAYRTMAQRVGLDALDQAVAALLGADELGAPLSPALRGQATAMRELRRREALDRAARAAPKIQLVVATLMVPAVMLLVVTVMAVELARQLGPVLGGVR
jgi:tight adherence protein C